MNFDFSALKRAFQGLQARRASIRAEIEDLKRQRSAVTDAKASRDEVKALIASWITAAGGNFVADLQASVATMANNSISMRNPDRVQQLVTLGGITADSGRAANGELAQALCALFGDSIRAGAFKAIDAMEWPVNGMSNAQRTASTQAIDAKISELETEEEDIVKQAAEAGLRTE